MSRTSNCGDGGRVNQIISMGSSSVVVQQHSVLRVDLLQCIYASVLQKRESPQNSTKSEEMSAEMRLAWLG